MEKETTKKRISSTTLAQNNVLHEANEQLQETKLTQTDEQVKVTAPTWTIVFPFLKEELLLSQIYELYPKDEINLSPEIKTEV